MTSAPSAATAAPALTARASRAIGEEPADGAIVAALRAQGAEAMGRLAMPSPSVDRPWKYLEAASLDFDHFSPPSGIAGQGLEEASGLEPGTLIQRDGFTVGCNSAVDGLTLTDFAEADEDALASLGHAITAESSRLTALHYAFLTGGVLVRADANAELTAPVRIARDFDAAGSLATPHTLIVSGPNSRLTVIEEHRSSDAEMVALPLVEILAGPGSIVHYVTLHSWGPQTRVFAEQRTITERDAALVSLSLVTGGRVVKSHLTSSLEGRGSSSELYGLAVGGGEEHLDFYTLQDHIAADTRSDLLFKSALGGRSRAVYYGLTRVGLEARRSDANQENRNLLLSRAAKADSDPVLEILTNDVTRVSHGATAGPVNDEELFYIQSRGLTREGAMGLLVRGFLGEVLDRSKPEEAFREELTALVEAKLRALGAGA